MVLTHLFVKDPLPGAILDSDLKSSCLLPIPVQSLKSRGKPDKYSGIKDMKAYLVKHI